MGQSHEHGHGHTHDHAGRVDDALRDSDAGIRAVKIGLVVLTVTAGLQIAIVFASGSVALLADTIHNFSDALTAIPLWIAFSLSRRALPDATPTVSAGPRIWPVCSWSASSPCRRSSRLSRRSTG